VFQTKPPNPVHPDKSDPRINYTSDDNTFRYFLSDEQKPHQLNKVDLRTGKTVWQKQLPDKTLQLGELWYVTPGVIRWAEAFYCFNPETGAQIPQIPSDLKATRQVFFQEDGVFHLSAGSPAVLTVYDPKTWKKLWSVEGLAGADEMVAPYAHGRLLCKAENALQVIDTKKQKQLAKITDDQLKLDYCFCYQTETAVLILCQRPAKDTLSCYSLPAGKLLWSRATGPAAAEIVAIQGDRVVMVGPTAQQGKLAPPVVAFSLKDGKELWQWQVPQLANQFYDSLYARVEACKSGFVVTRTWLVLD
jgi:outer membrane protein assembly factor BamB